MNGWIDPTDQDIRGVHRPEQPMQHRVRNLVLAIAAIALAVGGGVGIVVPVCLALPVSEGNVFVLHFFDGRVRLFWYHSPDEAIKVEQRGHQPRLVIDPREPAPDRLPVRLVGPNPARTNWRARINIGTKRSVPDFHVHWRTPFFRERTYADFGFPARMQANVVPKLESSLIRMPAWLPVVLLLIAPVRAALRQPVQRRRFRRNECLECGYKLKGLLSLRCPECGTPFTRICRRCGFDLKGNVSGACPECSLPTLTPESPGVTDGGDGTTGG